MRHEEIKRKQYKVNMKGVGRCSVVFMNETCERKLVFLPSF